MRPHPRETLTVPARDLLRGLAGGLRGRPGEGTRQALRAALRTWLDAPTVLLLGSARVGLWRLLADLAARHPGAEVVMWGYNFFAVPDMARLCGLVPVFADAADTTGEPSPEAVARLITSRTRGLLVSHHFGRPATMDAWTHLAAERGLTLIEDAAHAFGARWGGRSVGLFGAGGVFSLSLTKGLVGGGGGVLVSADAQAAPGLEAWEAELPEPSRRDVAATLGGALVGKVLMTRGPYAALVHAPNRLARALGADPIERVMVEPHAPPPPPEHLARALAPPFADVALRHLPHVAGQIAARRAAAEAIVGARRWRRLELPPLDRDRQATWLNLVVRTPEPEALRRHLLAAGFDTRRDYLSPAAAPARLPVAARLAREGVYLPVRSLADLRDTQRLVDALAAFDAA